MKLGGSSGVRVRQTRWKLLFAPALLVNPFHTVRAKWSRVRERSVTSGLEQLMSNASMVICDVPRLTLARVDYFL